MAKRRTVLLGGAAAAGALVIGRGMALCGACTVHLSANPGGDPPGGGYGHGKKLSGLSTKCSVFDSYQRI